MGYYAIRNWEGSFSRLTSLLRLGLAFMVHTPVVAEQQIYYSGANEHTAIIGRIDFPSGNQETLLFGVRHPNSVALDPKAGKVYWASGQTIERADLNGDNRETFILTEPGYPFDIALDIINRKIYWSEDKVRIRWANLDGSDVKTLIDTDLVRPKGLAIDAIHSKLYWANGDTDRIERADLDGANRETLLDELYEPDDLSSFA